jgi:hypothetical protein
MDRKILTKKIGFKTYVKIIINNQEHQELSKINFAADTKIKLLLQF